MISKTERFIRGVFIVGVAAIQGAIIWGCITKNSDAANWIIAGANVAMALAAYYAYRYAKMYLSEFFAKEGYSLAIKMVNDNLIELGTHNKLISVFSSMVATYKRCDNIEYENINTLILRTRFEMLQEVSGENKKWMDNVDKLSQQMLSYGITVAESKKPFLLKMLTSLDACLEIVNIAESIIYLEIRRCERRKKSGVDLSQAFTTIEENALKSYQIKLEYHWNEMLSAYGDFFKGDRHIHSLFSVSMRER